MTGALSFARNQLICRGDLCAKNRRYDGTVQYKSVTKGDTMLNISSRLISLVVHEFAYVDVTVSTCVPGTD